jgi:hypothetical protein
MFEVLKIAYEFIKRHLREIEAHSAAIRVVHRYAQTCTSALRQFVIIHPILVLLIIMLSGTVYVFYNPQLLGKDKCYVASINYDVLVSSDTGRECHAGRLVALAWDNFSQNQDQNRGSLLVNDEFLASTEGNRDIWSEVYVPIVKPSKTPASLYVNFKWRLSSEPVYLDFQSGTCVSGNDSQPDGSRRPVEANIGFTLRSDLRSGLGLSAEQRTICDNADLNDPNFQQQCKPIRLEMFIPSMQPAIFCQAKTPMDYWMGKQMSSLPQRPYLCIRPIALDGTVAGPWSPLGVISQVLCD